MGDSNKRPFDLIDLTGDSDDEKILCVAPKKCAPKRDASPVVRSDGVVVSSSKQGRVIQDMTTVTKALGGAAGGAVAGGAVGKRDRDDDDFNPRARHSALHFAAAGVSGCPVLPREVGDMRSFVKSRGGEIGFGVHIVSYEDEHSAYNGLDHRKRGGPQLPIWYLFKNDTITHDELGAKIDRYNTWVAGIKDEILGADYADPEDSKWKKHDAFNYIKRFVKDKFRYQTGTMKRYNWLETSTDVAVGHLHLKFYHKNGILATAIGMNVFDLYERGITMSFGEGSCIVHMRNLRDELNVWLYFDRHREMSQEVRLVLIRELGRLLHAFAAYIPFDRINFDHPTHRAFSRTGQLVDGLTVAPHFSMSNRQRHSTIWQLKGDTMKLKLTFAIYGSSAATDTVPLCLFGYQTPVAVPVGTEFVDCLRFVPFGRWSRVDFFGQPILGRFEEGYVFPDRYSAANFQLRQIDMVTVATPDKWENFGDDSIAINRYLTENDAIVCDIRHLKVGETSTVSAVNPFYGSGGFPFFRTFKRGAVVTEIVFGVFMVFEELEEPLM